jgi:release factor glutamine methyltransferase
MAFLTIKAAVDQGVRLLDEAQIGVPRLTAEVLLCYALGQRDRVYLYAHGDEELTELAWIHYGRYLHQRIQGKPTQYIIRRQEFFGRDFTVTPDVLIPRPETEHAVAAALDRLEPGNRVVDVGCGSGAIAITIVLEKSVSAYASDISAPAIRVAAGNARALGARVQFVHCNLLDALASERIQMVISNPPYVGLEEQNGLQREVREYEPHVALFAGADGTEIYAKLIADAPRVLCPNGWLVLELGWKSLDRVLSLLGSAWTDIEAIPDLAGIPRVLCARRRA